MSLARHLLHTAPDDIYVGSPPLGFTFGLGALLIFPLAFRASVALVEQPSPDALLAAIERYRATCLFTAPTMYGNLLKLVGNYDLTSLERCVSAGEALSKGVSDAWFAAHRAAHHRRHRRHRDDAHLHRGRGRRDSSRRHRQSAAGYTACVVDDELRPLPPGQPGWLVVKGPDRLPLPRRSASARLRQATAGTSPATTTSSTRTVTSGSRREPTT